MRKFFTLLLMAGFSAFFLVSCENNDDNSDINVYVFPSEAAARYIALAFCSNSGGINFHMENIARISSKMTGPFDSVFTMKRTDSAATIKYDYSVNYTGTYITGTTPKVNFEYVATGSFSSAVMSSNDQQDGPYTVTGLDTTATNIIMNGTGTDVGSQVSPYYNAAFSSSFSYTLHDVLFDKHTYWITAGTASVHISGNGPANIPFSFGGTMTFNGSRKATLVLDNITYSIDLVTGTMSK